jgi:hypothetical protein
LGSLPLDRLPEVTNGQPRTAAGEHRALADRRVLAAYLDTICLLRHPVIRMRSPLSPAAREPCLGEGVPQLVGVNRLDAGLP